jgi:glycosyltransferase involved in cell wall biosynthesis
MKVLFDHPSPFALAHGGFQVQIEQTKAGLERRGIEVEYVRWWDEQQSGNIIHYFGRPSGAYIDFAHAKGIKIVMAELLSGLGSRPALARIVQKTLMRVSQACLPGAFTARMAWDAYRKADGIIALTNWEAHLMQRMFDADPTRIHVLPNGVEEIFFQRPTIEVPLKLDYLVCTAAIHPRKRVVELAEAAALARVPVWIIGKPYTESDSYFQDFLEIRRRHPEWVRYEGPISDRAPLAKIYQQARGFVLLSAMETLSLSALEAAASGCPLLLSDLPWAKSVFGDEASYVPLSLVQKELAGRLASFYTKASSHPVRFKALTWDDVARQLETIYRSLAESTSR